MGLPGREKGTLRRREEGDTRETWRESDIQNGREVKSYVAECRLIGKG